MYRYYIFFFVSLISYTQHTMYRLHNILYIKHAYTMFASWNIGVIILNHNNILYNNFKMNEINRIVYLYSLCNLNSDWHQIKFIVW